MNEQAYDMTSVCVSLTVTSFSSKEEDNFSNCQMKGQSEPGPTSALSTGCYYDSVVDEHQMS
jgi:hypothetical protein